MNVVMCPGAMNTAAAERARLPALCRQAIDARIVRINPPERRVGLVAGASTAKRAAQQMAR